jgi:hypothetical protein
MIEKIAPTQPRPLWPHQVSALALTRASLLEGHRSPLLQIPTGGGRTEIATAFSRDHRDNGCRVNAKGWAAHQFKEKFGFWPEARHQPEREPTPENWVRSRQIAYAKARQRYG